jgi:hypothetical protein
MLIGSEKNSIIPCLSYEKNVSGIQYKPFVDYKTDTASDKLPLPSDAYWHTLEDVLTQYVRHSNNKFDYDNQGIAISFESKITGKKIEIDEDVLRKILKELEEIKKTLSHLEAS